MTRIGHSLRTAPQGSLVQALPLHVARAFVLRGLLHFLDWRFRKAAYSLAPADRHVCPCLLLTPAVRECAQLPIQVPAVQSPNEYQVSARNTE